MTVGTLSLSAQTPAAITEARRALWHQLNGWRCNNVPDTLLVFSELVTNAVEHAGGAFNIVVTHGEQLLRFDVHDTPRTIPERRDVGAAPGGFGLRIVSQLSHSWGWERTPTGKVVWANIPCRPAPTTR